MDILIEPDCFKACRICMENCEDDFVCVYDEFEDNILMDVITECARVEIRKDDALPRNACRNCAEYMIIAYHIIQKCRDSDHTLRSIFKHEIELRSRKDEEKIFSATDLHEEDLNPEEYEFLLSEAYDNMILDNVEDLIAEQADDLPSDFPDLGQVDENTPPLESNVKLEQTQVANASDRQLQVQVEQPPVEAPERKRCCGCKKEFDNEAELKTHGNSVHFNERGNFIDPTRPFQCQICFKSFVTLQHMKEHQRISVRRFFCRQCGKGFMTQVNLENHHKCHYTSAETKKCCGCRREFQTEEALAVHSLQAHKPEQLFDPRRPFECAICYRRYPTRKSLVSHKRLNQQHQCVHCGEIFAKRLFLTIHERTFHADVPKEEDPKRRCCGCYLEFPNMEQLQQHASTTHKLQRNQIADETKPFECDICCKRFISKYSLHHHQKKANQGRRYVCEVCGRSFNRAFDKANHATTHSTEMPFACDICGRRFKNRLYLKNHLKLHASGETKEFVCPECGKCFRTKDLLKTHSITHSEERRFVCSLCSATFKRMQCLRIHLKIHNKEKPYGCTLCDRRYTQSSDLKRHMLTHSTGDEARPYQCEYCLKRYPRKDYLKIHVRKQHLEKADLTLIEEMAFELGDNGDDSDFLLI
ncbi:oocyte zinc finger protein XlCOF6-like isoform X2 [Ochlerotatus camptorhynchus]|uniref:oocyte zinc finger protein XlCOF6-like isoform X2 n=1 Tax=Ochlerotatus camptorhynchus TaxID=644619 RepID=UPI0031D158E7